MKPTYFIIGLVIAFVVMMGLTTRAHLPDFERYRHIFYQNLEMSGVGSNGIAAARETAYWFDWAGNSAIAMEAVRTHLGNTTDVEGWYKRYEYFNQQVFSSQPNPGVDVRSEGKLNLNGTVFSGPSSRPQNEGPAQRVIVRVGYANWLLSKGRSAEAAALYKNNMAWGGIKWELEYVKNNWASSSFDLWGECLGFHMFNLMVSRKALYSGAVLAYILQDYDYSLDLLFQAANINNAIPKHFDDQHATFSPHLNTRCADDRQSMDIVVQLATLYGNIDNKLMTDVRGISQAWYNGMCASHPDARCATIKSYLENWSKYGTQYWTQPKPHHSYNLFSLWSLGKWSRANFPVAEQTPEPFYARYAWDRFDGSGLSQGNPWMVSSFAASQIWSRAGQYFRPNAAVDAFEPNYTFYPQHYHMWSDLIRHPSPPAQLNDMLRTLVSGKVYTVPKNQWTQGAAALRDFFWQKADLSISTPFTHIGFLPSLPQQLHRFRGDSVGAAALTWNYASLVFADFDRRSRDTNPQ